MISSGRLCDAMEARMNVDENAGPNSKLLLQVKSRAIAKIKKITMQFHRMT
jgi:hypothetical protein